MDLSVSGKHGALALGALLALTVGAGTMQAANSLLAAAVVSGTVTCNTATGPGTARTIVIKALPALTGTTTVVTVTFTAPTAVGLVVTPASATLNAANQTAGVTFTVNTVPGCTNVGAGLALSNPVQFRSASATALGVPIVAVGNDVSATVVSALTAAASALVAAPVTISCVLSGGMYTPGPAQTVSITSAAVGGTPFAVDTTLANDPAWITLNPLSPTGSATATASTFTVQAATLCGSFSVSTTHTVSLHLLNLPAPDKLILVSLNIVPASPLIVTPVPAAPSVSLSYVKSSGTAANANVSVSSTLVPGAFFSVNTSSLPIWLTVDSTSGTVTRALRFTSTNVVDSLAPGAYTATVYLQVSGYGDFPIPITLLITNKPPKLSVSSTTLPISWTLGTPAPTATITVTSSDSPIQYSITTGGTLAPIVSGTQQSGLAYSFGTSIGVTFNPLIFASAAPGSVLTGTVTFTWGSPASVIVVTINLTVVSPGATLTSISPATLPTAVPGTSFQVTLTGTGFVGGTDPTLKTRVGTVSGSPGVLAADTNFSVSYVNPSNIILTIVVPTTADPNLPFAPAGISGVVGGPVYLGLVNGTSTIPSGTATLSIGGGPIIQGITSSSSFTEVTPPALPTMAPYDMVSIFGANFCSAGVSATNCSSTQILSAGPDTLTLRYPLSLSPDVLPAPPAADSRRLLSVTFQPHGLTTPTWPAPLLFGTNGQINAIVPAAVSGYVGAGTVDVVVGFGCASCTPSSLLKSTAFPVNIAATDPGIFTVGSDGQGSGAALDVNWALISNTNPAGMRSGGSDSDTIQLYVTGLGVPTSTGSDLSTGSGCIADVSGTGNYMATLQAATSVSPALTNIDGAVIQSALLLSGNLAPCLSVEPSVTIGGVAGVVTYAGFVADTVAGLYQINVQLPVTTGTLYPFFPLLSSPIATLVAPAQLPVQVTVGGATSQSSVTVWVTPRLAVAAPTILTGTVGVVWTTPLNLVVATEGTSAYHYAVTSGVLPAGLSLSAAGAITGTPGANSTGSYVVTVTATDSASIPVTGTVTFTLTIAGGLYMTSVGSGTYTGTFATANATLTPIVTATGGTAPYAFAITAPVSLPTGMTVNTLNGRVGISALTPAGTYNITVTATDSTTGTPLTGMISFTVIVGLKMVTTLGPTDQSTGSGLVLAQVTATGNSGTLIYTLDAPSVTYGLAIDSSGNITTGTALSGAAFGVIVTATDSVTLPTGAALLGYGTGTQAVTVHVVP